MGGCSNNHHPQIINSFIPWLRPLEVKKGALARRSFGHEDDATTCSTYSSAHPMMMHRRLLSISGEPTSPKIGCMGQIKMCKSSPYEPAGAKRGHQKLFKFTRMLSRRSLSSPRANARIADDRSSVPGLDVANMDPPLPVVREIAKGGNPVSLWSRRCKGQALEGLQLRQPACGLMLEEKARSFS